MPFPIVDAHIHLYASTHVPRLSWTAELPSDHPLNRQNSIEQYRAATTDERTLRGFVFLETDRKSGLQDNEWQDALEEVNFLVRIAEGKPIAGEGHTAADKELVLGIVPWAPIPAGSKVLGQYLGEVRKRAGESYGKIKGFRYLLQNKPAGTMLSEGFIEGLQALGTHDLSFDLGIDARSAGLHQLEEACELFDRVNAGNSKLQIIINHMCKPDLHITPEEVERGHPSFVQWKKCISRMAGHKNTYMKLSGMFSELPPQGDSGTEIAELVRLTKPWIDTIFETFGPSRIMFGSDWPVCNVGGPGVKSWSHYVNLVTLILQAQNLNDEEQAQIWSGTAVSAYKLKIQPTAN
jgi:L-rhamnono-1,4-lactonase